MNYSGKKSNSFIYEGNLTVQICKVGVILPVILMTNSIRVGFERDHVTRRGATGRLVMLNNFKSYEDSSAALGDTILSFMLNPDFFCLWFKDRCMAGSSVLLCGCQSYGSSI